MDTLYDLLQREDTPELLPFYEDHIKNGSNYEQTTALRGLFYFYQQSTSEMSATPPAIPSVDFVRSNHNMV